MIYNQIRQTTYKLKRKRFVSQLSLVLLPTNDCQNIFIVTTEELPISPKPFYQTLPNKSKEHMAAEIINKDDLNEFRELLLNDFKALLQGKQPQENAKWLKSYQVKNMLKISPGTLQNLRVNGTIRYTKIGGILYYKQEDIQRLLEGKQ
jgi:hypothetical protein